MFKAKLDNPGSVRACEIERSPDPGGLLRKAARYPPFVPNLASTIPNVLATSTLREYVALRYCLLIPIEAGWPGSLKRLPVFVMVAPSTLRMDTSWSR